jgi:hypothetical protein
MTFKMHFRRFRMKTLELERLAYELGRGRLI